MKTPALGITICLALFAGLFVERAWERRPAVQRAVRSQPGLSKHKRRLRSGNELVLVLVGSSTCGASKEPLLPAALSSVGRYYEDSTRAHGETLVSVGVALDWDLNAGLNFLNAIGSFDEISIGRNWLNSQAVSYFWRDHPGEPALPQLMLVRRQVDVSNQVIGVSRDTVIKRWVGVPAILRLSEKLAPKMLGSSVPDKRSKEDIQ